MPNNSDSDFAFGKPVTDSDPLRYAVSHATDPDSWDAAVRDAAAKKGNAELFRYAGRNARS